VFHLICAAFEKPGEAGLRAAHLLGLRPQTLNVKLKRIGAQQANGE